MKYFIFVVLIVLSVSFVCSANISLEDAQLALQESAGIINELTGQGFSTTSISDSYSEALLVFQQATYADILRNNSISDSSKIQAKNALRLVNWKNINYENVLYYTEVIQKYKDDSYYIVDSVNSLNKKIESYVGQGVNVSASENLLLLANKSFYDGQIKESLSFVERTKAQIEIDVSQASSLNVLATNAKNFFLRYIYWIIFAVVFMVVIGYFSTKYIKLRLLKKRISKMEMEENILVNLMKKTQTERYKENKISGLIYNIRMKKYQERLSEIKQDLPVLRKHLSK